MFARLWRIFIGLVTIIPLGFMVSVVILMWHPFASFGSLLHWSGIIVLPSLFAGTGYCVYVTMKSDWPESRKTLWVLLLVLWFPFAGPVYWYRNIWRPRIGLSFPSM